MTELHPRLPRVGDLAAQAARELQDSHIAMIESGEKVVDQEEPMTTELRHNIFTKIDFRWRSDDRDTLEQLRHGVDRMFAELFDSAITVIDNLYCEMRVADTQVINGETVAKRDSTGRILWKRDPGSNQYIEDWGQLTGQDIEKCLFDITSIKLALAPTMNDLLMEAVFAKHIFDDAHQDAYAEVVQGTVGDRNAHASRKARPDKYHAFFRYYLWSQGAAFMRELDNFTRVLERVRYWGIEGGS